MKKHNTLLLRCFWAVVLVLSVGFATWAQKSRKDFENERKLLEQRITATKQILRQNTATRKASLGKLNALIAQAESQEALIRSVEEEIQLLEKEIARKGATIRVLCEDLQQVRKEYAAMVCVGAKTLPGIDELTFVFSASSFQHLVKRLMCVKQYAEARRQHLREIDKLVAACNAQQRDATARRQLKKQLLDTRKQQRERLLVLTNQQRNMVGALEKKRARSLQALQQQQKAMSYLDGLIRDVIRQEQEARQRVQASRAQKGPKKTLTKADRALSKAFAKGRGRLRWPVQKGFVSGRFGVNPHPVLKNVQVECLGLRIQTESEAQIYPVCQGIVKAVAFVPGMHHVVIVQHGTYHSVYAHLKTVAVDAHQRVDLKTVLGTVYTDLEGVAEVELQLWQGAQKLNPAHWLSKR